MKKALFIVSLVCMIFLFNFGVFWLIRGALKKSGPQEEVADYNPPSEPDEREEKEYNYSVSLNSELITDIRIRPGDEVLIQANGTVDFGEWAPSLGPDGGGSSWSDYRYDDDYAFGALLYKYGSWGWDEAGEYELFEADESGYLELMVNDRKMGDNTGSFRVKVIVTRLE